MSRYIDADATRDLLIRSISLTNGIDTALKDAPSIDIVRCGECKHRETCCRPCYKSADSYCSDGEREGE
jgi:hypothetical protein